MNEQLHETTRNPNPYLHTPFCNKKEDGEEEEIMITLTGSCYCRAIKYQISLNSPDDARTSLCHCGNCKKAFGTNYGLTAKISKDALEVTQGTPKTHSADNGSGSVIHREFCGNCGSFIMEYGVSSFVFCFTSFLCKNEIQDKKW